jgi:hypothetical protein
MVERGGQRFDSAAQALELGRGPFGQTRVVDVVPEADPQLV